MKNNQKKIKLNNICLTNIKNYYVNKKTDNLKNNLETIPEEKENNIHKSITEETKLEDNLLDLKIKELEFLRDPSVLLSEGAGAGESAGPSATGAAGAGEGVGDAVAYV